MQQGKVKWYNETKGYGFICPNNGGSDVFVHITEIEKSGMRSLQEGQMVEFDKKQERGKTAACSLKAV